MVCIVGNYKMYSTLTITVVIECICNWTKRGRLTAGPPQLYGARQDLPASSSFTALSSPVSGSVL